VMDSGEQRRYRVVVNHEEQYSVLSADRDLPPGWSDTEYLGAKEDCLAHIERIWTDMRPLTVRRQETAS
jgi:MbtH protein